jgi:hypothetical protein
VQAAHSAASARHAAEKTVRCLGILTPCLGIFPIMRLPLRAGQYRPTATIASELDPFHCGKQIFTALPLANRQLDAGRTVR